MGFENRDYYRGEGGYTDRVGGWGFDLAAVPPVVKRLVAANIVVFLLQIFFTRPATLSDYREFLEQSPETREAIAEAASETAQEQSASGDTMARDEVVEKIPAESVEGLTADEVAAFDPEHWDRISIVEQWLELDTRKVIWQGQIWRLITCAFCHDRHGLFHILFNMLFLWWFGQTLELMYGSREFLLFYLTAAMIASLAFIGLDLATGQMGTAIGASGAVMAVTMVYACYYPRHTIRIMFILPVEIRWIVLFYVIWDLHPVLLALAGDRLHSGVGHAAHLGGLAFGFLHWKQQWRLEPLWDRTTEWSKALRARQRGLRVVHAPKPRPTVDDEVDRILEKIGEQGLDSLTPRERQTLERASQRYRERET